MIHVYLKCVIIYCKLKNNNTGLCFHFRGSGCFAYFYASAWQIFRQYILPCHWYFQGSSSGSLMAALALCRLDLLKIVNEFDHQVDQEYEKIRNSSILNRIYRFPWMECRIRYSLVPALLKRYITQEVLEQCINTRLKVLTLSLGDKKIIHKTTWRNVDELIEWILASMAIPFVTSFPRRIDGMLLMDAFSLDYFLSHQSDPVFDKLHHVKFSPLAIERHNVDIHPLYSAPSIFALFKPFPWFKKYLIHQGFANSEGYLQRLFNMNNKRLGECCI
jgi:hypothetical protein